MAAARTLYDQARALLDTIEKRSADHADALRAHHGDDVNVPEPDIAGVVALLQTVNDRIPDAAKLRKVLTAEDQRLLRLARGAGE